VSRKLPPMAPPQIQPRAGAPEIHIRSYQIITPLFGGGVEPQHADPITIVRASAIRGHLRFWWRATQGGRYGRDGLARMKQDEDALWGSTSSPSMAQVEVRNVKPGILITKAGGNSGFFFGDPVRSPISYAAFPLRQTTGRAEPGGLSFGVEFQLAVTLPTDRARRQQVIAALWAWETFGGLGARTRRGFGALKCTHVKGVTDAGPWQPSRNDEHTVTAWLRECLEHFVQPGEGPENVPMLDRTLLPTLGRQRNFNVNQFEEKMRQLLTDSRCPPAQVSNWLPALVAWYYPLEQMRRFRQTRYNNNRGQPFGRSYWPEPDEIRWCYPKGFRGRHAQPQPPNRRRTNKFPRAAFGLPIVFQFKDQAIDPPQTTLQGIHHDRLASRLILRPLACADGNFVSMALVLKAPALPPGGLRLVGAGQPAGINTNPLTAQEAGFQPLNGNPDVLQAFLDTL